MGKISKINIVVDKSKKEAAEYAKTIIEKFGKKVDFNVDPSKTEFVIIIGGDGMMYKAKEIYWSYNAPLLGLNFGYKGFLMNLPKDPIEAVSRIVEGKYKVYNFPLLTARVEGQKFVALSDVFLNRIGGKSCKFNVKINGVLFAKKIIGDGFIVSTALGSTGYSFSAGGPIISSQLLAICLTPVAVYTPTQFRPMVFPLDSQVEIEVLNLYKKDVKGWYDGLDLPSFKKIKIQWEKNWIKVAFWAEEDFAEKMVKKIMKI